MAELARAVGVSTSALTQLFFVGPATKKKKVQKSSRLVDAIHKHLGMLPPSDDRAIAKDPLVLRFLRAWADLSEEDRVRMVDNAERLARKT